MIINHTYGFIFVHNPKTAGSSISRHLSKFSGPNDVDINHPLSPAARYHCEKFGLRKHSSATEVESFIGDSKFAQMFKFGVVRDPYERAYSLYAFLKYSWRNWPGSCIMDEFRCFDEFVASEFFLSPGVDVLEKDSVQRLFCPQAFWLCDAESRVMVDYVARMERLEADFGYICSSLGLPRPERSLERVNVSREYQQKRSLGSLMKSELKRLIRRVPESRRLTMRDVYANDTTRRIVTQRYEVDFAIFCYQPVLAAGHPAAQQN